MLMPMEKVMNTSLAFDRKCLLHGVQHFLGDDHAVIDGADRRHDREFIAIEPRCGIALADDLGEAVSHFLQQLIAGGVA